jgi:hypothetical protein
MTQNDLPDKSRGWQYSRVALDETSAGLKVHHTSHNLQSLTSLGANLDLDEALTAIGLDGWKLIGQVINHGQIHLLFRRPLRTSAS